MHIEHYLQNFKKNRDNTLRAASATKPLSKRSGVLQDLSFSRLCQKTN